MSFSATVTAAPEDVAGALLAQTPPAGQQEAFNKAVELAAGAVSWLGPAVAVSVSVSGHQKENPEGSDLPSLAISMYVATPVPPPIVTEDAAPDAPVVPPLNEAEPEAAAEEQATQEAPVTEAQVAEEQTETATEETAEATQADASQTSGDASAPAEGAAPTA